jgi:hypothetical protein
MVWVDGKVLIRFFSCQDGMYDLLEKALPLQHRELLCSHDGGGLHPRVAKGGKLLPRNVYDKIIASRVREEQRQICAVDVAESSSTHENRDDDVSDCVISPSSHLFCQQCVEAYGLELAKKEQLLSLVLDLYDVFKEKYFGLSRGSLPVGRVHYAVSKKFVTAFRKEVDNAMEGLTGIDSLDLSFLPCFTGSTCKYSFTSYLVLY